MQSFAHRIRQLMYLQKVFCGKLNDIKWLLVHIYFNILIPTKSFDIARLLLKFWSIWTMYFRDKTYKKTFIFQLIKSWHSSNLSLYSWHRRIVQVIFSAWKVLKLVTTGLKIWAIQAVMSIIIFHDMKIH